MSWLILIIGLILLITGGDYLVKGAVKLAKLANLSPMVIGLTVVAMGTSAPELALSIDASFKNLPDFAIGNVIGSNIANLTLVLGLTSLILPTALSKRTLRVDWPILLVITAISMYLMNTGLLTRLDGFILLIILLAYNLFMVLQNKFLNRSEKNFKPNKFNFKELLFGLLFFSAGLAGLIFGADLFLNGAEAIARNFGVSDHIIAITLVAFGTSLPELVTSLVAAFKQEADISVGNLIGSNVFNLACVLGFTAVINPVQVSELMLQSDIWWMLAAVIILLPILIAFKNVNRFSGAVLLAFYGAYIFQLLF
jgi:cation:H+ antiporter